MGTFRPAEPHSPWDACYLLASLIRPPDKPSADIGFTAILFLLLRFFFFRQLPSQLAKRNSTKTGQMLGSECDLKMHVRNLGIFPPPEKGAQNHLFPPLCNLTANLTAYIQALSQLWATWGPAPSHK